MCTYEESKGFYAKIIRHTSTRWSKQNRRINHIAFAKGWFIIRSDKIHPRTYSPSPGVRLKQCAERVHESANSAEKWALCNISRNTETVFDDKDINRNPSSIRKSGRQAALCSIRDAGWFGLRLSYMAENEGCKRDWFFPKFGKNEGCTRKGKWYSLT